MASLQYHLCSKTSVKQIFWEARLKSKSCKFIIKSEYLHISREMSLKWIKLKKAEIHINRYLYIKDVEFLSKAKNIQVIKYIHSVRFTHLLRSIKVKSQFFEFTSLYPCGWLDFEQPFEQAFFKEIWRRDFGLNRNTWYLAKYNPSHWAKSIKSHLQ